MAENANGNDFPQATVARRKGLRVSMVWLIPILAAVVAIGIAVQRIMAEGPTITVVFKAAPGIEAGKTFIKYKDVNIGQVTDVRLADDYTRVKVTAKIAKSAAGLMVEDAKLWVVEPRIALSGISGLGTLFSGNYIGFEVGKSREEQRAFTGLDAPPVIAGGQPGRQFVLKADKLGSLDVGTPVYYRGLLAGQVSAYNLSADGRTIEIKIFVNAPYDKRVVSETRFWNKSGVDVTVGANGLDVRTESLLALLAGGLAFDVPAFEASLQPVAENASFTLYDNQPTAMKQPDAYAQHYVLYFDESLRGLSVGAPVTLLGLQSGEVVDIGLDFDQSTQKMRGRVEVVTYPERIVQRLRGSQEVLAEAETVARSAEKRRAFFQRMVQRMNMRAQIKSANLLTGQNYLALDFFPNAPAAKIELRDGKLVLPVVASTAPNIEARLSSILDKLDKVQYEAIDSDLRKTLEEFRQTTAAATRTLKSADQTLIGPAAPAQQDLRDTLQEVALAARSLRMLTDYLERHPEALIRGKPEEKK